MFYFRLESAYAAIQSYSHALLCRDRIDGSLRGFSGFTIKRHANHTVLRVGLSLFKNYYNGGPYLYITIGYIMLKGEQCGAAIFICM